MSITVTASTGAKVKATRDALETRGTHLTGQAGVPRRTPGRDSPTHYYEANGKLSQICTLQTDSRGHFSFHLITGIHRNHKGGDRQERSVARY